MKEEKDILQDKLASQFDATVSTIQPSAETDFKEVWFMGCHADVGGGAVPDRERHMLSRIPLRWMIRQCFECKTGILFTTAALAETGIDIESVWPVYKVPKRPAVEPSEMTVARYKKGLLPPLEMRSASLGAESALRSGTFPDKAKVENLPEQVEDYFDALASINDQLVQARKWWILEFWPVRIRVQRKTKDGERWEKVVAMNLGRYRAIRDLEPSMHWTVHMLISDKKYEIQSRVDKEAAWSVVTS
jgi:hypothetical protein